MSNIKDYGVWTTPKGWEDITLKQYQEIEALEDKSNMMAIIAILCRKKVDEVMALPTEFLETILGHLNWLSEAPEFGKPSPSVTIGKETYQINTESKLKTGEYLAVDSLVKSDPNNYAAILAILCRKPNEEYNVKFEAEVLEERIKFWEQRNIFEVMGLIAFFLRLSEVWNLITLLFSQAEEGLNLTQQRIETSRANGELSVLRYALLKRKLKHLRKYIQRIYQRS